MEYIFNNWNPLSWIYIIVSIPAGIIISIFSHYTIQDFMMHHYECIRGDTFYDPYRIFVILWIVKKK